MIDWKPEKSAIVESVKLVLSVSLKKRELSPLPYEARKLKDT